MSDDVTSFEIPRIDAGTPWLRWAAERAREAAAVRAAAERAEATARKRRDEGRELRRIIQTVCGFDPGEIDGPIVECEGIRLEVHYNKPMDSLGSWWLFARKWCPECKQWDQRHRRLYTLPDLGEYLNEPHNCERDQAEREEFAREVAG